MNDNKNDNKNQETSTQQQQDDTTVKNIPGNLRTPEPGKVNNVDTSKPKNEYESEDAHDDD